MSRFFLLLMCLMTFAYAEVGEIVSVKGGADAYLTRNGDKIILAEGSVLEVGDILRTENSHVVLILFPKIQMSLVKGTEIKITSHMVEDAGVGERTESLIDLIKGLIRIQVTRDDKDKIEQKVNAREVSFAVRGTEYEVSSTEEDAELDVIEGEVEVTSPHVQTFVPEIVKPKEGFRFERKKRKFERRAFRQRVKESQFLPKTELNLRWQKRKAVKQARKERRWEVREQRILKRRHENREERRERKGRGR